MRVLKDCPFEFGYLVWQVRPPVPSITVVIKATFQLRPDGSCVVADEQVPCQGEVFWDDDATQSLRLDTDLAILKPRGECFLAGTCHPPGGAPVPLSAVSFRVGQVQKRLAVFGDRYWQGLTRGGGPSAPVPFTAMPLRWERAFGGPGFDRNPVGVGLVDVDTPAGRHKPLPNLEDPARLITSPGARPEPAGCFPVARTWKARASRAGTYDKRWVATRWPWFPDDFAPSYFNAAPADQQIEGFWRGDEVVALQNLHPEHARLESRLPGLRAHAYLQEHVGDTLRLREVPLRLDTITVDADRLLVCCLWRGTSEVASEKLVEVERLFYLHGPIDAAVTLEEAQQRLDRKLREEVHEEEEHEPEEPALLDAPTVFRMPPAADEARVRVDAVLAPLGTSLAALEAENPPAPPAPPPSELRQAMQAEGVAVPAEIAALPAPQEESTEIPPAAEPEMTREAVEACVERGEPLVDLDLTGLDLSGLDLSRVDFSRSVLKGARLHGCRLEETCFEEAVLVEADLGACFMNGARFKGADLTAAVADGSGARGACLDEVVAERSSWKNVNFAEASLVKAELAEAQLEGSVFQNAHLDGVDLTAAVLDGCDLRDASLVDAQLERVHAEQACFDGADLKGARPAEGACLSGATFRKARADGTQWQDSVLHQVDLSFATLEKADFTGARLVQANLTSVVARQACFQDAVLVGAVLLGADVLEGSFEGADLSHADLRGANLFGAQFWRAKTDHAELDLANVRRTHLERRGS